jgi:uncharacterized repeat protein (TIGR01451 family)
MRKQFLIWFILLSSVVFSGGVQAARLEVFLGGAFQNIFGTIEEFVEVSPVVTGTASKCSIGSNCVFTVPNGTTITIKLTLTPAAQDFKSWVDPLPGVDANKVCIGGAGLTCTFDTGQDTTYYAKPEVATTFGALQITFDQGTAFRKPTSAEVDVQYLGVTDAAVFTISVLSEGRQFSPFLSGPWKIVAVRAEDTECQLVSGQTTPGFAVQKTGITPLVVRFKPDRCGVIANVNGAKGGQISSSPEGITACTDSCNAFFQFGLSVSLTATPNAGFVFERWSSGERTSSISVPVIQVKQTRTAFFVQPTSTSADLEVTQTSISTTITQGSSLSLTLTVKNNGADTASNVTLNNSLPDNFAAVSFSPSQGSCLGTVCNLGDLMAGASATVSLVATPALGLSSYTNTASVSSSITDPVPGNNISSLSFTIVGDAPPVKVSLGSSNPVAKTVLKGSSKVAALQVLVAPPAGSTVTDYALAGLTLHASGTGNDASDITAVKLFPDNNGNGLVDTGEDTLQISSGVFSTNDGTLNLSFAPTGILAGRNYLIALDFNSVIARNQFGISLGSVFMLAGIGFSRRRKLSLGLLGLGLMVMLVSCPGGTSLPETRTYKLTLTAINIQKAGSSATVSGLPLSSAVLSVEK